MMVFTFAGDESGDVSFNFGRGASRYFVIAVVATSAPDELRGVLENLRQLVFHALSWADFDAWAILVDKTTLGESFKAMSGLDLYLFFVSELIRYIPEEKRLDGTLILDEFGYADQTKGELKRILKARNISHGFRRISIRRSQSEPLIQVADLIAGAIWRRDTRNDTGAYETIEKKIKRLVEYGN